MKKLVFTLCIGASLLIFNSCGNSTEKENDSDQEQATDSTASQVESESATLTLSESSFGAINLPIQNGTASFEALSDCDITEEMAVAEGGEFKVYHVNKSGTNIADFEMSMDDSSQMHQVVLRSADVADQYGLKVGDLYSTIKEKRPDAPIAKMGYHFSTYLQVPGSHVSYELQGDYTPPSDLTMENVQDHKYTEADLAGFKITAIIWGNTVAP